MRTLLVIGIISLLSIARVPGDQPEAGKQVEQELKVGDKTIRYLLYLPREYGSGDRQWPLMLFLHGAGERTGPLSILKKWGPPRRVDHGDDFPFIIASPQCPERESWAEQQQEQLLMALLDHLNKHLKVDTDRIYLTGLSMGGYGSWRLAADHPERFAAVVPICGGGKPADAEKLKHLPIWVFHGTDDSAVPVQRSI